MTKEIERHVFLYVKILKIHRTICVFSNRVLWETKSRPKKCRYCGEKFEAKNSVNG